MTTATFPIEDVLSVTTGRRLCKKMSGLYAILNHLTGDSLFAHQLPRAIKICAPQIIFQHPDLADVDASHVTKHNWGVFVDEMRRRFGDVLPLAPITNWEPRDPLQEAADMVGGKRVIVAVMPEAAARLSRLEGRG